jgi:acetylglutamate kinase
LENAGIESKFVDGFRYTSSAAIKIVKNILCGEIQDEILSSLRKSGVKNITAICGDEDVIRAEIKTKNVSNKDVDLGYVGDVSGVHTAKIVSALDTGSIVVLSAIGKNEDGTLLNINADSAAAALAAALKVDELILLTDVDGVFSNWPDQDSLISDLTLEQALELMPNLVAGMLPKLEAAITALKSGVPKVRVLNGSDGEALLISQSNNASIGTVIS